MSALLPVRTVEKVWGRRQLPAPFSNSGKEPVGEIWFEPPLKLPDLLVKYIFTNDKLSVQTHPDDDQAQASGLGRNGKEECWIILDAEEGAKIAVGFVGEISSEHMRAAALDGTIEDLLQWHEVRAGDFFYIPANTVHAIGGGVSLLEIQQNCDITYRLYDYGRPRELHLDAAIAIAKGEPHPTELRWHMGDETITRLVDGPKFRLERIAGRPQDIEDFADSPLLVIPTTGMASVAGEEVLPGSCALATSPSEISISDDALCFLAQPIQ